MIGTRTGIAVAGLALAASPAHAQGDNSEFYTIVTIYSVGLLLYLIPTYVAFYRRHPNRWVIFVINVFLGGTGIGWFGSLIWAFMAVHRTNLPDGSHGGESGLNLTANDVVRLRLEPSTAGPPPLPVTPVATSTPDVLDRLERLKRLHDAGAVDDDQFRRMRDTIIASVT